MERKKKVPNFFPLSIYVRQKHCKIHKSFSRQYDLRVRGPETQAHTRIRTQCWRLACGVAATRNFPCLRSKRHSFTQFMSRAKALRILFRVYHMERWHHRALNYVNVNGCGYVCMWESGPNTHTHPCGTQKSTIETNNQQCTPSGKQGARKKKLTERKRERKSTKKNFRTLFADFSRTTNICRVWTFDKCQQKENSINSMKNGFGGFNECKTKWEHFLGRDTHTHTQTNSIRLNTTDFLLRSSTKECYDSNFSTHLFNFNVSRFDGTTFNCVQNERHSQTHTPTSNPQTIQTVSGIKWHRWKLCHPFVCEQSSPIPPLAKKWQMQTVAETSNGSCVCVCVRCSLVVSWMCLHTSHAD